MDVKNKLIELTVMLRSLDIPVAHQRFDDEPPLPYIIYKVDGRDDVLADDNNYYKLLDIKLELYADVPDFDLEARLEKMLEDRYISYMYSNIPKTVQDVSQTIYEMRLF